MWSQKTLIPVFLVATVAYYLSSSKTVREGQSVETKSGTIRGAIGTSRDGQDYYQWLGIPYAKPPIGELRFASPEPIEKWNGVRDGSKYGSQCPQNDIMFTNSMRGEEDCLFLNVYVPKHLYDEKKVVPVLFYIHGGAYILGGSQEGSPTYFMDEDVVVVVINYRLDVLGFSSTGDKAIRGNMGLKDQTMALKWVNENIQYFGGDPNQITILGHSAGGASVNQLLLSPRTKGLFHKAISHSGAASNTWGLRNPAKSLEKTKSIAQTLGCPTSNSEELAQCLRKTSLKDLMGAVWNDDSEMSLFRPHKFGAPPVPTIEMVDDEDAFLTQHPLEVMAQGKAHKVPWMIGHTADEGYMSTAVLHDEKNLLQFESNLEESLKSIFSVDSSANETANEKAAKIRDFYLPPAQRSSLTPKKKMEIYSKLFGDGFFNFDIRESILYQRQFAPVYPYYISKTNGPGFAENLLLIIKEGWTAKIQLMLNIVQQLFSTFVFGMDLPEDSVVLHAADLFIVFPMFTTISKSSKYYEYSKQYVKLLVDFAYAKDDAAFSFRGVKFPATPKSGQLKFFEITNDVPQVISEPFQERMEFLHTLNIRDRKE